MSNKLPKKAWKPGTSGNLSGRGKGGKNYKKSKLRKTEEKLVALHDMAFLNIEKSVAGEDVGKDQLASSKWVVNSLVTVSKSALQEEMVMNEIKASLRDSPEDVIDEDEEKPVRFSLHVLPTKSDLE